MFGVFCNTIAKCNQALDILLKEKQEAQDEVKRLKLKYGEVTEDDDDDDGDDDDEEEEKEEEDSNEADTGIPGIICTDDF